MNSVFFDVDTQIDFMFPSGALYVPGAETILPAVVRLNQYAARSGMPLISTTDAHAENDPEFRQWPGHCIRGTNGQHKPPSTLLSRLTVIPSDGKVHDFPAAQQFVLQKQQLDAFTNPNLSALLNVLDAERYVVYGVVTELCVRFAALGLLKTGKRVEVVSDAIRSLDDSARDQMLAEIAGSGGFVTTTEAVIRS
jgi:nicotinamidase/pyrazinamidase